MVKLVSDKLVSLLTCLNRQNSSSLLIDIENERIIVNG